MRTCFSTGGQHTPARSPRPVSGARGWAEPGGEGVREPRIAEVPHPGDISVGTDQHGGGRGDLAKDRKLPHPNVFGVDLLNAIGPWSYVEAAGRTEVEQHRPSVVQQVEDPQLAV